MKHREDEIFMDIWEIALRALKVKNSLKPGDPALEKAEETYQACLRKMRKYCNVPEAIQRFEKINSDLRKIYQNA